MHKKVIDLLSEYRSICQLINLILKLTKNSGKLKFEYADLSVSIEMITCPIKNLITIL